MCGQPGLPSRQIQPGHDFSTPDAPCGTLPPGFRYSSATSPVIVGNAQQKPSFYRALPSIVRVALDSRADRALNFAAVAAPA